MVIAYWILAGLLALAFLGAGGMKLARSKQQLGESGMGWVEDFPAGVVKMIGGLEVLGAVGVIVPPLVGIATVLAPLAATGLGLTMVGAIITHLRRHEAQMVPVNLVLLALSVATAAIGFVLWA